MADINNQSQSMAFCWVLTFATVVKQALHNNILDKPTTNIHLGSTLNIN